MLTLRDNARTRQMRRDMHGPYPPFAVRPALRRVDRALWSRRDDLKGACAGVLLVIVLLVAITFASKL